MKKVNGFGQCFICGKFGEIQAQKNDKGKVVEETKKCVHECR